MLGMIVVLVSQTVTKNNAKIANLSMILQKKTQNRFNNYMKILI